MCNKFCVKFINIIYALFTNELRRESHMFLQEFGYYYSGYMVIIRKKIISDFTNKQSKY
jgi:hypothetical protein